LRIGITSSLSVAGVLAAGAAAFALNSAVLSGNDSPATSNVIASAATVGSTIPTPSGSAGAADSGQVTTNSTKVSATSTTYTIGEAGSVIVDTASGAVVVTDVVPASGWTAEPARTDPSGLVKVHFTKGSTRLEFSASLVAGAVKVNTVSENAPPALGTRPGTKPSIPAGIGGGDDDDDHHDDQHDGTSDDDHGNDSDDD